MVKTCAVFKCGNRQNDAPGVSFHRLPKDENRRKLWLEVIPKNQNSRGVVSPQMSVCSEHFVASDFIYGGFDNRIQLNSNAVPSVFGSTTKNRRRRTFRMSTRDIANDTSLELANADLTSSSNVSPKTMNVSTGSVTLTPVSHQQLENCEIKLEPVESRYTILKATVEGHKLGLEVDDEPDMLKGENDPGSEMRVSESGEIEQWDSGDSGDCQQEVQMDCALSEEEEVDLENSKLDEGGGALALVKTCLNDRETRGMRCAVSCCSIQSDEQLFHEFPLKEERNNLWTVFCQNPSLTDRTLKQLRECSRICSDHFAADCFEDDLQQQLLPSAVPTQCNSSERPCLYHPFSLDGPTPQAVLAEGDEASASISLLKFRFADQPGVPAYDTVTPEQARMILQPSELTPLSETGTIHATVDEEQPTGRVETPLSSSEGEEVPDDSDSDYSGGSTKGKRRKMSLAKSGKAKRRYATRAAVSPRKPISKTAISIPLKSGRVVSILPKGNAVASVSSAPYTFVSVQPTPYTYVSVPPVLPTPYTFISVQQEANAVAPARPKANTVVSSRPTTKTLVSNKQSDGKADSQLTPSFPTVLLRNMKSILDRAMNLAASLPATVARKPPLVSAFVQHVSDRLAKLPRDQAAYCRKLIGDALIDADGGLLAHCSRIVNEPELDIQTEEIESVDLDDSNEHNYSAF